MTTENNALDPKKPLIVNCSEIIGLDEVVGSFKFKRLNLKEKLAAAVKSSDYKEGKNLSIRFENVAYCLAVLETAAISRPNNFNFDDIEEETLFDLYDHYDKWVDSFRGKFREKQEANSNQGS